MSDIFSKIFTGNLVEDATYKELNLEKSPINFTIATNFANNKIIYTNCVYCISTKVNPEILKYLKKGTKLTVISNYMETENWDDEKGQKKYKDVTYVTQFVLGSRPTENSQPIKDTPKEKEE